MTVSQPARTRGRPRRYVVNPYRATKVPSPYALRNTAGINSSSDSRCPCSSAASACIRLHRSYVSGETSIVIVLRCSRGSVSSSGRSPGL